MSAFLGPLASLALCYALVSSYDFVVVLGTEDSIGIACLVGKLTLSQPSAGQQIQVNSTLRHVQQGPAPTPEQYSVEAT